MKDSDHVGTLCQVLLEAPSQQLLPHELVERFVEHPFQVHQIGPKRAVRGVVAIAVPFDSGLVIPRGGLPRGRVLLRVLPFNERELGCAVMGAVGERRVDRARSAGVQQCPGRGPGPG